MVPGCRIEYAADAGPDKRSYCVDFTKIQSTLPDFQPQWDVRRGAEQLYHAYQNVGLTQEEFEGPRFRRIDHIKQLQAAERLGADLRWVEQNVAAVTARPSTS